MSDLYAEVWETICLPQGSDGRSCITAEMAVSQPHIGEMVRRAPDFWQHSPNADVMLAAVPGQIFVRYCHAGEVE